MRQVLILTNAKRLCWGVLILLASATCLAEKPKEKGCNTDLTHDPYQKFNRKIHAFNDFFDRWALKPAAKTYRFISPKPVERGVSNFFGNLGEVRNIVNDGLQWKWKQAGHDTGRLLINSTLGIGGLFDVAKHAGLKKSQGEDFDQTLAKWGVCSGNFIVLPFLGPSTFRDAVSIPFDRLLDPVTYIDHDNTRYAFTAAEIIQIRASLLEFEKLASGDRYLFLRDAYRQRRVYLQNDGEVKYNAEDEFSDFQ